MSVTKRSQEEIMRDVRNAVDGDELNELLIEFLNGAKSVAECSIAENYEGAYPSTKDVALGKKEELQM